MRTTLFATLLATTFAAGCGGKSTPAQPLPDNTVADDGAHQDGGDEDGYGGDEYGYGYGGDEYGYEGDPCGGWDDPCGGYVPPPPMPPDLNGSWASACFPGAGKGEFQRMAFTFTADRWDMDYDTFGDAACTTRTVGVHIAGSYTIGAQSPTVVGAWDGDFTFETRVLTADTKTSAKKIGKACGIKKLKAGKATDIHAKGCPKLGIMAGDSCSTDFDVVQLIGNHVHFGVRPADNNLCTVDKRPTAIDAQVGMKYQWKPSGIPECDAYFRELDDLFACPAMASMLGADAFVGIKQMESQIAAQGGAQGCQAGTDAMQQARSAMGC